MLHLVRVRIDLDRLPQLGLALQDGTLDTSSIRATYCLEQDPAVGLSIWETENAAAFETAFAPHRTYYREILEIAPVILPAEAKSRLLAAPRRCR